MSARARPKSTAKALRKALAEQNLELSHRACLEIVARQFGVSNWNVLKAASEKSASLSFTGGKNFFRHVYLLPKTRISGSTLRTVIAPRVLCRGHRFLQRPTMPI